MPEHEMSPLSAIADDDLLFVDKENLIEEIILFRKALSYCRAQHGDDNCWMDYRHLLMRFLPGYNPETDDVVLAENQLENCKNFIHCWQTNAEWRCLGGDKGKVVPSRSIGTLDCLRDWPEDFSYENGQYQNTCYKCGSLFIGHKRRVVCKMCG